MSLFGSDHRELVTALLEGHPAKLFVLAGDGSLVYANSAFLLKFGRLVGAGTGHGTPEPSPQLQAWWEHIQSLAARIGTGDSQEKTIEALCLADGTKMAPAVMVFPVCLPTAPPLMGGLIADYDPCRDHVGACRQGYEWYFRRTGNYPARGRHRSCER